MPGVLGTCARYIAANFPAPISATRSGRPCASRSTSNRCRFISGCLQRALQLLGGSTVLPGQWHVVRLEQAIVGQAFERREVAVRDVARTLESPDVVRHGAQRQIDAGAVPRRQI